MTPEQMLREFHAAKAVHGGLMPDQPTADIPGWVRSLRMVLLDEEVEELRDAVRAGDIVKIADALADIEFVTRGTAVAYGIPSDAVFAEVFRSNMTKDNTPAEAKLVKGPRYEPPRIAELLAVHAATQASRKPGNSANPTPDCGGPRKPPAATELWWCGEHGEFHACPGAMMADTLRDMQAGAWRNKLAHGFNTTDVPMEVCLLLEEVAEAFSAWRKGKPDLGGELADIQIFLLSLAQMTGIDLQAEVEAKLAANVTRAYRKLPNGTLVKTGKDGSDG